MSSNLLSVSEVNSLSDEQFESRFGNVIELCKSAAAQVTKKRPFGTQTDLCDAFNTYLTNLSLEEKLIVLRLHPDLAGRLATKGELTHESTSEQQYAGLNELTPQQKKFMDESNERYKKKFGFPFIICARKNGIPSIIEGLKKRYQNPREEEIYIAIEEVKQICKFRISDIVKDN